MKKKTRRSRINRLPKSRTQVQPPNLRELDEEMDRVLGSEEERKYLRRHAVFQAMSYHGTPDVFV